jgi:DNA-binding XRE family transcriptional regulator
VQLQGGDLWLERTTAGLSFCSVWPLRNEDPWPLDPIAFGKEVRLQRLRRGLSQVELAQLAGLGDKTVFNVERATHRTHRRVRRALIAALSKE